ncbi:MAG: HAMP domain-containing sensor histidine kinase, partial [Pseudomonadota bacterium]
MNRGDTKLWSDLLKRWADVQINEVQSSNAAGLTSLLSTLENTRERQTEREAALQREAELKAIQLEQQSRLNRMLWILIAGLTIAFNMLLAFLRYREKNNRKMQALSQEALSAEKMKTEFLGVINHELRTPLNGIIGISDAMIHNTEDPALLNQAKAVQDSGQVLFDLLDSLITMSTIEGDRLTLDKDDVRLDRVVSGEVTDWARPAEDKGLEFTHFIGAELEDAVVGDANRLKQCLRYLLSNAVRFTHDGRIHVHATAQTVGNQLHATIIVADTGQGISEEVQSRLFKPFLQADAYMTRKYGGAGLSLAIARKLARMMDGDLIVNSREGRGSEFTMTVKLQRVSCQDKDARSEESRQQLAAELKSRDLPVAQLATTSKQDCELDLSDVDDPEEIIDLMLNHPIFAEETGRKASPDASRMNQNVSGQVRAVSRFFDG